MLRALLPSEIKTLICEFGAHNIFVIKYMAYTTCHDIRYRLCLHWSDIRTSEVADAEADAEADAIFVCLKDVIINHADVFGELHRESPCSSIIKAATAAYGDVGMNRIVMHGALPTADQLLHIAACAGNLPVCAYLMRDAGARVTVSCIVDALKNRHINCAELIYGTPPPPSDINTTRGGICEKYGRDIISAVFPEHEDEYGVYVGVDTDIVRPHQELILNKFTTDQDTQLDVVKFLDKHKYFDHPDINISYSRILASNCVDCVKYIHEFVAAYRMFHTVNNANIMAFAATIVGEAELVAHIVGGLNGRDSVIYDLDTLKYLCSINYITQVTDIEHAMYHAPVEHVKFAFENAIELPTFIDRSIISNSIDVLKYVHSRVPAALTVDLYDTAINELKVEHVEFLHSAYPEWTGIIGLGHSLDDLQYCLPEYNDTKVVYELIIRCTQLGVKLGPNLCEYAAKTDNLKLIHFAHANGVPFNNAIIHAISNASTACIIYIATASERNLTREHSPLERDISKFNKYITMIESLECAPPPEAVYSA